MTSYKHGSRPTIGVLAGWQAYHGHLDSFLAKLFRGIQSAARFQGCNILLACGLEYGRPGFDFRSAWAEYSTETDFVPVGHWNTDGLIVIQPLNSSVHSRYIRNVITGGHPVLFVGVGERGWTVAPDNSGGVRQAVEHFIAHGHRQIAFIKGNEAAPSDSAERLLAFQATVHQFGLADDPRLVVDGGHNIEYGRRAMEQLLSSGATFSAVLASNDSSAIGAMDVLRAAGRRIPQDVAVIGIDNRPETVTQSPPLTSVEYPTFKAGYRALELMHRWIEQGGSFLSGEDLMLKMELVRRRSCGCQPDSTDTALLDLPTGLSKAQQKDVERIVSTMRETLLSEGMHLPGDEVSILCRQFLERTIDCIRAGDLARFRMTVEESIDQIGTLGDDPAALQTVLPILETMLPALFLDEGQTPLAGMLKEARQAVDESARLYTWLQSSWKQWAADQVGLLMVRLQTALDEERIFELLMQGLSQLSVEEAQVVFYEAEAGDPLARSVVRSSTRAGLTGQRFPTRQFPQEGLYPDESPYQLALMPLVIQTEGIGFVAFEATQLETCAAVVRQLAAALKGAWLYREAVEGRKLAEEGRKLAEEADRMKSRFLSTVSHELRTPLNLIVGLSNLVLQEDASSSLLQQDLEQIHLNAEHLGWLIRDVLDLATSQAGQLRLEQEPLDLVEALGTALEAGGELARQKGLEWQVTLPQERLMVMGDRTRLRQVLLNLVSNAVKFTGSGQVAVKIEARDRQVLVSVGDTGLGIPPEEQGIIFDEFRQSERTASRGYGGMGLGLAISRRLVELHGGRIGAQSSGQEGSGSTFYFTLPVLEKTEPLSLDLAQRLLLLARQAESGQLLRDRLTKQGFQVEFLLVEESFDLDTQVMAALPGAVVVDSDLAVEQGWEILKRLKENPATRQTPVLFYSLSDVDGKGSLLELDYLMKPLGQAELAQAFSQQGLIPGRKQDESGTILVVDDDPGTLALHVRMVRSLSPKYEVLTARNGREALDMIRGSLPDLVLLDLMMPEMDGFGVLEAMRTGETTRDIPVVVLTAQVLTESDMARLNRGVATVLQKGLFSTQETLSHIEAALARQQRLGGETQRLVRKAMAYLHTHYFEQISLEALADHVGVHRNYLTRCFRQEMSLTPFAYLTRYRINRAKTFLAAGDKSVGEVAEAVGFSDISYFSRAFQKEVKVSPGAYRRGQRSGKLPM